MSLKIFGVPPRRNRPFRRPIVRAGLAVLALLAGFASGQVTTSTGPSDPAQSLLRVFMEGPGINPQTQAAGFPFVRLVPEAAQAQVLISIGEEGEARIIRFRGRAEFDKSDATVTCRRESGESIEAFDSKVLQTIKLGLMRYVSKTPAAGQMSIRLLDTVKPTAVVDPWNFWVFSASADVFLNGEQTYRSRMWMGNFSAKRITPQWKISFGLSGNFQTDTYTVEDFDYRSESNSRSFNSLVVRSLGEHWSAGARIQVYASTFSNIRWSVMARPALEYDVFPYSESTKKQFRFLYSVGPAFSRYVEETIYDRTRETLLSEALSASLELKQPWGSINTSLEGSHYFGHWDKYRLALDAELSIRLFQGMSFNIEGSGSRIHDQLALAKGGATYEEVLLRRKQLATGFQYFFSVGFSYSFGSIFSNVINPRFGSGNSGMSMRISM
jgi:hypothetical protein